MDIVWLYAQTEHDINGTTLHYVSLFVSAMWGNALVIPYRPHLHYTSFYPHVASWNDLCQIGQLFILYWIALQQYGMTFISPAE